MNSKGEVLPFILKSVKDGFDQFERTKSVIDFIKLLGDSATHPNTFELAEAAWKRNRGIISIPENTLEFFINWLSRVRFNSTPVDAIGKTEIETPADQSNNNQSNSSDLVQSVAKALHEQSNDIQQKHDSIQNVDGPFKYFLTAWPYEKNLELYPSLHRAGALISRYVETVFSGKTSSSVNLQTKILFSHSKVALFLTDEILPTLEPLEKNYLARYVSSSVGRDTEFRYWLEQLIKMKFALSSLLTIADGTDKLDIDAYLKAIPKLPEQLNEALIDAILDELVDAALDVHDDKSVISLFDVLLLSRNLSRHIKVSDAALLPMAYQWVGCWNEEKPRQFVSAVMHEIKHQRRQAFGITPINLKDAGEFCEVASHLIPFFSGEKFSSEFDLSVLIAPRQFNGFGCFSFNWDSIAGEDWDSLEAAGKQRALDFLLVFYTAIDEGLYEFANATLAFLIFTQPLMCGGRLYCDWSQLGAAIHTGHDLPGFDAVKEASEIAVQILTTAGETATYDVLGLKGWVPCGVERSAKRFDSSESDSHKRAVKTLQDTLSPEIWLKLSIDARRSLTTAEKSWYPLSSDLGHGRSDFGQLAVGYIKAIEIELTNKLGPIFLTSDYADHVRRKQNREPDVKPTFGSAFYLLRDFYLLSEALQNEINALGITTYADETLMKRLFHFMRIRNDGAHSGKLSEEQFVQLRSQLFKDGVLKRVFLSLGLQNKR